MTSVVSETALGALCLKLLLGKRCSPSEILAIDWEGVSKFLQRNVVLLRMHDMLERHVTFSASWHSLIAVEKGRIASALSTMEKLGAICEQEHVQYMFPKALWHSPDMGHDIDLLVDSQCSDIDEVIRQKLSITDAKKSLVHSLAGKIGYTIDSTILELEIHHGRSGHLGELIDYPALLIARGVRVQIDGRSILTPSVEDQVILSVLQRMYGHFYFRVSDVVNGVSLVNRHDLDWDYIHKKANQVGVRAGLNCYLEYMRSFSGMVESKRSLPSCRMKNGVYRFPNLWLPLRLYGKKWVSHVVRFQWESVFRVTLLPLLGVVSGFRFVYRKMGILRAA